jgi:hypothetical protein
MEFPTSTGHTNFSEAELLTIRTNITFKDIPSKPVLKSPERKQESITKKPQIPESAPPIPVEPPGRAVFDFKVSSKYNKLSSHYDEMHRSVTRQLKYRYKRRPGNNDSKSPDHTDHRLNESINSFNDHALNESQNLRPSSPSKIETLLNKT